MICHLRGISDEPAIFAFVCSLGTVSCVVHTGVQHTIFLPLPPESRDPRPSHHTWLQRLKEMQSLLGAEQQVPVCPLPPRPRQKLREVGRRKRKKKEEERYFEPFLSFFFFA